MSHQGDSISPDGPAAYLTSLPIHEMISAINNAGIPAHLSMSAGAYVCNDVYYALLGCEAEFGHKGLFVHVPGEDAISVEDMAQALEICLCTAL